MQVKTAKSRRDFLHDFADRPATFVREWLDNQVQDLDATLGRSDRGTRASMIGALSTSSTDEDLRRSTFYRAEWLKEAIKLHGTEILARKASAHTPAAAGQR